MNDQGKTKEQLIRELKELREELDLFKALSSENIQIANVFRNFREIYDNFYKSNPYPMWIYDLETLAFLDVNNAAIKHYGYSQEEFLSMTIKDIRPPEDIPALLENIAKVTKGLDMAGTWRHIKKDGALIYVEITSHTLTFAGRPCEIVLANDITDRRRAEKEILEKERFMTSIFESIQDGISILDKNLTVIRVNAAMEKWYKDAMPIIGKKCYEVYHGRNIPCEVCPSQRTIETGNADYEVVVERDKEGKIIRYVGLYTFPLVDTNAEQTKGVIEYVRDITEQKNAEAVLKAREKELKKRVKELEEFYDIAVGRELRMKQLKEENDNLKGKLEKYQKQ